MSQSASSSEKTGVLLVGHGTHSALGQQQFLHLARLVGEQIGNPVEPAFLEMCEPTIGRGVGRLVERQGRRLIVAPVMLFAAAHVQRDIPQAVEAALTDCGATGIDVAYAPHFGCHELILELAARRLSQSLAACGAVDPTASLALIVGRGSHDADATGEMHEFATRLAQRAGVEHFEVAFLAMAQPPVEEALRRAAEGTQRQIVVYPHFLFEGDLVERLRALVASFASQTPGWNWQISGILAQDLLEGGIAAELLPKLVVEGIGRPRK